MIFDYKELEKVCIGQFEANSDLFKTTVKDNINKHRKGVKTVVIKDKNGQVMANTPVKVTLKNHEFKHGAHIFMLDQFETEAENKKYREFFADNFNLATIPFYWDGIEPTEGKLRFDADSEKVYRRPAPDYCLDFCRANNIDAKIHCLFYDKFLPGWVPKNDAAEMKRIYEKRFREIAERYGDKGMYEIEVINELLETHTWKTNSVISDTKDSLEWSFALAEKYFPNDTLVINDANYVPAIGKTTYRHPYYMLIDAALAKGVRIDKIGVQNHIYLGIFDDQTPSQFAGYYDPVAILKGLDVLSEFNRPLEITEVTIPTFGEGNEAEDMQAEVFKYLYTLWFSSKNVESVVYWNTVDKSAYESPTWNENRLDSGVLHKDLTPKKSAKMLEKLFKEEWHTELELVSDAEGKISFDGFHGDYDVQVLNGRGESKSVHLYKESSQGVIVYE